MAYYQNNHDDYYQPQQNNQHYNNAGYGHSNPSYETHSNTIYSTQHSDYDAHSNWDSRSTKSYGSKYADSQAHLNPQEMSQVDIPALPSVPYTHQQAYQQSYQPHPQQNYPPLQQRPGMGHEQSSGWSVAKDKMMKRRSVRQVELYQGNLVLDVPVPSHIVPPAGKGQEEMTTMRYTAATCDPDDFMRSKYSLRPYLYGRKTELFIVMTMYNEDEVLFLRTMNS